MEEGFSGATPFQNQSLWHSRGYLTHYDGSGVYQLLTYRLSDSLPQSVLDKVQSEIQEEVKSNKELKRRKLIEKYLDAGYGSCILANPKVAEAVIDNWRYFDGIRYDLISGVVMPNHVHVLIKTRFGWPLSKVVWTWKKYVSKFIYDGGYYAASACGAPDKIWQREYWDRFIRDQKHFSSAVNYIFENPYKAGLITKPNEWKWLFKK